MHLVSILGLVVLLGIAWAMSYYRREVNLRPILWGLGLQFVLALIILRQDVWSFVGMILLGLLIVVYQLEREKASLGGGWQWSAGLVPAALAIGFLLYQLPPPAQSIGLGVLVLLLLVNSKFRLFAPAQSYLAALFVILGVTWFISRGIHGQEIFQKFSTKVAGFLNLSDYGARFLFGNLADGQYFFPAPRPAGPVLVCNSPSRCCPRSSSLVGSWACSTTSALCRR